MELQQLRYVVALAETLNFTRAAQQCHIVQSAMSHQINALEQEIGVRLFARTSRRVELTKAGVAFLPAARSSLAAATRAVTEAAAADGRISGNLTIGMIPTVTAINIPSALRDFNRTYPAVQIKLHTGGSDEFINAIIGGTMDVAVLGLPDSVPPEGVHSRELARERLVTVVSSGHRLADRRKLKLIDLAEETFVDFSQNSPGRAQSDLAFDAAGIHRRVTFEAMTAELILDLVRNNLAVALLSPAVVPDDPQLRAIALTDSPTRIEYLACSNFNPSPIALAFLNMLTTS